MKGNIDGITLVTVIFMLFMVVSFIMLWYELYKIYEGDFCSNGVKLKPLSEINRMSCEEIEYCLDSGFSKNNYETVYLIRCIK